MMSLNFRSSLSMGLFAWLMIIAICLSMDVTAEDHQKDHFCYKLNEMTEVGEFPKQTEEDKVKCKVNQCFRMKYWTETSADGKKKDKKYPGYFGGCREDLPGQGGPWAFPNDCKDYTVSRDFLDAFLIGHGKKVKESSGKDKLNTEYFYEWINEIKATKAENCTENENIEFKYDYKVEMCYCKNEKDQKTPCNGKAETIGVSKSGVATLALTIVLLAISIIGVWFFVKSCQVNKGD